jgi:uncharacterized C2H2 Zn-finger protein
MDKGHENCPNCGNFFNSKQEMEYHVQTEHANEILKKFDANYEGKQAVKEFKCSSCTMVFETTSSMKRHRKRNHQSRRMEDQSFAEFKSSDDKHCKSTLNEGDCTQNFSCVMCKLDFQSIEDMDSHMDEMHGGRWKLGDEDVIREGDDYEETSSEYSDTESESEEVHTSDESKSEDSET